MDGGRLGEERARGGGLDAQCAHGGAGLEPDSARGAGRRLGALLEEMVRRDASDLHLTVGSVPKLRIDGRLEDAAEAGAGVLVPENTRAIARALATDAQWARFEQERELDFAFERTGLARFRANLFMQRGCVGLALRRIPLAIPPLEELGLPAIVPRLADLPRGLVLVTGPTGSGKSTTLAAIIDRINRDRRGHILTVEDPVEFVHRHRRCLVNQREVGSDTTSFGTALKHALREDPDVVLVGEMRDLETIHAALTIAETGHLAFATLHTNSAAETINRIVDVFPAAQQAQVRAQLAFVLQAVVTQTLVPRAAGPGRVCCCEVLVATPAVRACIREDKVHQLYTIMQSGRKHGMQTLNEALHQQVARGAVALETALQHSSEPNELLRLAGRDVPA